MTWQVLRCDMVIKSDQGKYANDYVIERYCMGDHTRNMIYVSEEDQRENIPCQLVYIYIYDQDVAEVIGSGYIIVNERSLL